jgi:hypothetical protein
MIINIRDERRQRAAGGLLLTIQALCMAVSPHSQLITFMYGVVLGIAAFGMFTDWFPTHVMSKLVTILRHYSEQGDTDKFREVRDRPGSKRVILRSARVYFTYAKGGHMHPVMDLLLYGTHMGVNIYFQHPVFVLVLGVMCIIDFRLRADADRALSVMRECGLKEEPV